MPQDFYFPAGGASVSFFAAPGQATFARLTRIGGRYRMHVVRGEFERYDDATNEALAAWERGEAPPPGGESLDAVRARVVALADRLAVSHAGQMMALVSHVGPIKALVAAALGLAPSGAYRMWLDTASICVVDWQAGGAEPSRGMLRVFNASAHLDPPARWLRRARPSELA